MQKAVIYGTGEHFESLVQLLASSHVLQLCSIVARSVTEELTSLADQYGIPVKETLGDAADPDVELVIDFSGRLEDHDTRNMFKNNVSIVASSTAWEFFHSLSGGEGSIPSYRNKLHKINTILDSTHDGMIAINDKFNVTLFNKSAEKMTGHNKEQVMGKQVQDVIPSSQLPRVMIEGKEEINQEQILDNGTKIITTRIPIIDEYGNKMGAFAVFRDITEMINMAEEVTNLKSIQSMLHAIIQSSEEAISVVDEEGKGIMINPAYTKLTGLKSNQVIGKPATIDISEGESIHMQVLKTRKPVRGARLKVGPQKRDVVVNVAPIIVDGVLKGSVGVIHDVSEIKSLTEELSRARQIIRTLEAKYTFEDIKGLSEEMTFAVEQARLAASTPATVLLRGESGTGKELFAHAIHNGSSRKYNKFIRVNCAAISESLLESELFGYEEGAFSGALRGGKRGLFEEANGGSIFLDEIGELAPAMQAKLLRVLQEKEIRRVGGTKAISINVRVIAATNINLERKIADGAFREDLYYRLNRMPIYIPPLRARKQDIPILAEHLIKKLNQDYGKNIEEISGQAEEILKQYEWPGNVRELENVLGRAMIHMEPHEQKISSLHIDLPTQVKQEDYHKKIVPLSEVEPLSVQMDKVEKRILSDTLAGMDGNKTKCAKALGVSLRNLYYKLEKFGIQTED
ncbi:sigma-54 interaction domain-containing protein [Fictibacillus fluitans]|uniref:Sigma-54-dependent Fis family transcriptional regulator n=1 Tax=Fictibacillus fluitans TaxID=3058422 RepID=A0ABT8HWV6_9BACL|nr:sigma-54-dependent Fis family transcriptional regulator [Fictibacillus sp. NE201]MDN4525256.1 sigma-54-dependent Fis family transcriptional regulator [Fictibacillus sp. NE201]